MVAILEKNEHNVDFYPIVDFIEASPLRYALTIKPTVYVSHIRQFWSTARIETTEEGTKILATVDGILRTVSESSLRRNLKLQDEEGISSLTDTELFENLTLMGHNISLNQKFTFQKGFNEFSSNIATTLVCLATNKTYNFSKMIFDGLVKNVNNNVSKFLMYPRSHTTHSSPTLLPVTTASIPTVTLSETTPIRQYTRRARIAQSSALPPVADEPASPLRDVSKGEACPTDSGFQADQDRANIVKTSTLPMIQHQGLLPLLLMRAELEINRLKARVKLLEDKEGVVAERSGDDALIKGRNLDEGEAVAKRVSDDTKEMATVLTSIETTTVLASGAAKVPTGSGSILTVGSPAAEVPTGSDVVLTAKSGTPKKKKVQEQIDAQVARELEEQMVREDQRMSEQVDRDAEVARIHVEEELQSMIDGLDKSNETVAKYLQEYQQFASELPLERKIELVSDVVRYQDNYANVHKFQTQERKLWSESKRGITTWQLSKLEDFIPMGSKEEAERLKRKGLSLEQESVKKLKTSEKVAEEAKSPDEVPKEKVKEMMQLVPIEEVYVEALQFKLPIIDWKVYTEGQRAYWKIIRLGGSSASYQFFVDLLKHIDREDLNQLWALVKESLSNKQPTSDKEMEL
nr:xylulose kinase-1 [Tanacetum cinerariifolium]